MFGSSQRARTGITTVFIARLSKCVLIIYEVFKDGVVDKFQHVFKALQDLCLEVAKLVSTNTHSECLVFLYNF